MKFYLWSASEIEAVLGKDDSSFFNEIFNIKTIGNYHDEATSESTGLNILHLTDSLGKCAVKLDLPEEEVTSLADRSLKALFAVREKRVRPLRDDKILTDWNGLMIAALAKGARVLEEPGFATAAQQAADHILTARLGEDDLLAHHTDGGRFSLANDYVFMIWGLLELYESTFYSRYLKTAVRLNNALLDRFWDDNHGGVFMTPDNGEELLARRKELQDGSIPAGGSVAMLNFLRLARILGSEELEEKAVQIGRVVQEPISQIAAAHTMMMTSLDFAEGPVCEIVVCGDPEAVDTNNMISIIRNVYIPGKVVVLRPAGEENPGILEVSPLAENKTCINGKATAYICVGRACREPITDPDTLRTVLQKITGKN
ncbi:thioredoxin domain-containing protein [bacterium]|nr:thioredoxin domain-containing protein [bacterium]